MFTSYGSGRYQASETDLIARHRLSRGGERAVLRAGGLNSTPANDITAPEYKSLTNRNLAVCCPAYASSSHWGNDTAQTRMGTAKSYMQSTWSAASGKVLLLGGSMGGLLCLLWTLNNPTLVAACAVGIPAVSPIDIHDNNRITNATTSIEAAYTNLAGWNAAKATHDPETLKASYASLGVPIKVWYSNNDPVCIPSKALSFIAGAGCESVNMGDQTSGPTGYEGHAVSSTFAEEAADFLLAYA